MFNPAKKIIIKINASNIALDVILSQLDEKDRLYPVMFYFRKFTILELFYNIYDKELSTTINIFKV